MMIRFLFSGKILHELRNSITFRNGVLFSIFSFINSGVNFFLLFILANFISPDQYGQLDLFNTFVTLLSILISLNSTGILAVEFFKSTKVQIQLYLNCVILITTAVLVTLSIILLFISSYVELVAGLSIRYQWISLLICYFQVFSAVNLDIWRLEEKPISYGLYSMATVLLNFILTLLFVIPLDFGWLGRVYAQLGVGAFFFGVSIVFLIKRGYLKMLFPSKLFFKETLSFSIPLIPHNASGWLRQGLDRFIINYYYTATEVGFFSFAYNFANVILVIGVAFNATNSVFIYKTLANNPQQGKKILWRQTKLMIVFYMMIALIICIGTSLLIPVVMPKYSNSVMFICPLCIGAMFYCIYLLFVNYLFYYKKTKGLMYITFTISLLHVILSILLTRISILFTAYIMLLVNLLIMISVMFYANKIYKLR